MGRRIKKHAMLLERCFSRQEWEYLKRHEHFKNRLDVANETLDDVVQLCTLGDRLLKASEKANPDRALFHRVGRKKLREHTAD